MRPYARAAVALLALILSSGFNEILPGVHAQERVPAVDAAPRSTSLDIAKLYDTVVETIEKNFYDPALLKQLDWRARADAVRAAVLAASGTDDAVRQINALLAELKTSHTGLFTPDDHLYYLLLDIAGVPEESGLLQRRFWGGGPYYPGTGAFTRQIEGRHFVDGILEGSPAERGGLKYGDEILSVDGAPYSPIAAFRDKVGATVELAIRRHADAQPQRLQVHVVPIRPAIAFSEATRASARVIERAGVRIGYIHIWASHEMSGVKSALSRFEPVSPDLLRRRVASGGMRTIEDETLSAKPLDFLVIDMRGRVGGRSSVAEQYLELFDARQKPYWGNHRTESRNSERPAPALRSADEMRNPPFRGRSALLIDQHTRSAAEIMAHGYKRSAFGPVVGTRTAGAVSSGMVFVMPGDLLLYVAVAGIEFEGGQRLEGAGVAPDHPVERPLPYAAGADPVLDAAVDLLVKQSAGKRNAD